MRAAAFAASSLSKFGVPAYPLSCPRGKRLHNAACWDWGARGRALCQCLDKDFGRDKGTQRTVKLIKLLSELRVPKPRMGRVLESMSVPAVLFYRSNLTKLGPAPKSDSPHTIDGAWGLLVSLSEDPEVAGKSLGPVSIPASSGLIALTRLSSSDAPSALGSFICYFLSILLDGGVGSNIPCASHLTREVTSCQV